jgi:hypothetical protein
MVPTATYQYIHSQIIYRGDRRTMYVCLVHTLAGYDEWIGHRFVLAFAGRNYLKVKPQRRRG